jgi:hypothetical protein
MHLLTNRWDDPNATESLFLNSSGSFGWTWNRGATGPTGAANDYPNYPELEFGVNPWGETELGDLTNVSTTDLLPMQVSNIHSASMTVDIDANIMNAGNGWNLAFEMWLSPADPTKGATNPEYEIMVFLGNHANYYPLTPGAPANGMMPACMPAVSGATCGMQVQSGGNSYTLYSMSSNWSGPPAYNYLQFRDSGNSPGTNNATNVTFNGKLDIHAFLSAVNPPGNLYVTRFELGNETYQNSQGTTTISSVSFEVNGTTETALMKY